RFHRAAALAAGAAVRTALQRHGVRGSAGGLLRLEAVLDVAEMKALLHAQGMPADYVEALDADAAGRLAGVPIGSPAWHYPTAGWVDPRGLSRSWLADAEARSELRLNCAVESLRRGADNWEICDPSGALIAAAPVVVLCNGDGRLAPSGAPPWPIGRQRGQLSAIAASSLPADALPRLPIAGAGYVLPVIDDLVWFGASSTWNDDEPALRAEDQQRNLDRLTALLGLPSSPSVEQLGGRASFRWTSDDRLPIVGAVPASIAESAIGGFFGARSTRFDQPRFIARAPGLFVCAALGSRGIASAALGAQLLAAAITGAPVPAEADLLDALDPARFLSRRFRRDEAARGLAPAGQGQPPVGPIAGSAGT
ncbi:MAG: FAD-dependent 5-carboxymethylaminomethyl-2-thiouridine(34) oxidoreductase MnmC, partial [Pseudomonadota bacterium]|nr:FAD-dependent 5-carboxymethylaminomethyl-2-thiouridine(34) oxidoreductase MnmC [Pseudomonadota bacterium]